MKKFLLFFSVVLMVMVVQVAYVNPIFAQPEDEEEEEPVQTRPNPMERTTKGMAVRNAAERRLQQGKALGTMEHMGPAATSKMEQVSTNGHKHDSDETEDLMPVPGEAGQVMNKVKSLGAAENVQTSPGAMGNQAALGLGNEGEDTPGNPVNPVTSGAAAAYGWGDGDDTPGNPVNPRAWDPTDMGGDISDQFGGGQINAGLHGM